MQLRKLECALLDVYTVGSHLSDCHLPCDATPIIAIATWFSWLWYKANFNGEATVKGHAEERAACTQTNIHKGKKYFTPNDHEYTVLLGRSKT